MKVEDIVLCLPSDFSMDDQLKFGMPELTKHELDLRKGEAFDIIRNLRTSLRVVSQYSYNARNSGLPKSAKTKKGAAVQKALKTKEFWINSYHAVYKKMLNLGLPADDKTFRPLTKADLYRPDNLLPVEFCAKEIGWIWTVSSTSTHATNKTILEWEREGVL